MNRINFDKIVEETVTRTADLLVRKGAEYAGDADRLANFKRNADKNGQTILDCWAVYWGKHVDSINSFMARVKDEATKMALDETIRMGLDARSKDSGALRAIALDPSRFRHRVNDHLPEAIRRISAELSEPITGRFDDNINYSILCIAILSELGAVKVEAGPQA